MVSELKIFKMPEEMKTWLTCAICGKGDCEILVQENVPGGSMGAFHKSCLDELLAGNPVDEAKETQVQEIVRDFGAEAE
jgi:predicted ATP-grasp superfamily ATP-dependent carboligase